MKRTRHPDRRVGPDGDARGPDYRGRAVEAPLPGDAPVVLDAGHERAERTRPLRRVAWMESRGDVHLPRRPQRKGVHVVAPLRAEGLRPSHRPVAREARHPLARAYGAPVDGVVPDGGSPHEQVAGARVCREGADPVRKDTDPPRSARHEAHLRPVRGRQGPSQHLERVARPSRWVTDPATTSASPATASPLTQTSPRASTRRARWTPRASNQSAAFSLGR
jgi:hypothetical protein